MERPPSCFLLVAFREEEEEEEEKGEKDEAQQAATVSAQLQSLMSSVIPAGHDLTMHLMKILSSDGSGITPAERERVCDVVGCCAAERSYCDTELGFKVIENGFRRPEHADSLRFLLDESYFVAEVRQHTR